MHTTTFFPRRRAFTLVELITATALITILAGIIVGVLGSARDRADATKGMSILRNNGAALNLYLADNGTRLPGPLWPGQIAYYDPANLSNGRIVNMLKDYLDIPDYTAASVIEAFVPPAYTAVMAEEGLQSSSARVYVMNTPISVDAVDYQPFGFPGTSSNPDSRTGPLRMNALPPDVTETWAMMDADQQHPNVSGRPWGNSTPTEPIYGKFRHALFFDGRVERIEIDDTPSP
ncbi:MAG: prepilin-type N-terminal cleavage/methylation domain-containing protein [Verrucomicrobiota bacterium]